MTIDAKTCLTKRVQLPVKYTIRQILHFILKRPLAALVRINGVFAFRIIIVIPFS